MLDLALRRGLLIDGSGDVPRVADVGIADGRIVSVDDLGTSNAVESLDLDGLAVAPGFIDVHQHGDLTPLVDARCVSALAQGVTTVVIGNCGHGVAIGAFPGQEAAAIIGFRARWGLDLGWRTYAEYFASLEAIRPGVNIAAYVAHGAIRLSAMGTDDRPATDAELATMERLLDEGMAAGAIGMSSGLEYVPGMHADTLELTRLAVIVGRHGGTYASHIRNRGEAFIDAVQEAIGIAEAGGTRLLLSHLAPRPYATADDTSRVHELIDDARRRGMSVTIDTFPDAWGPSPLPSILPPWFTDGPWQDVVRRLEDPAVLEAARAAFEQSDSRLLRTTPGGDLRLSASRAHPEVVGRTLGEISAAWGVHLADVACRLLRDEREDFYSVLIQHRYATDSALDDLYRDPMCAFESDGVVAAPDGELSDMTMNRSTYGYTARVLGELVRDRQLFPIEEGVRRMTSLPAAAAGLVDRGVLRVGAVADVVVFDPARIRDRTTDIVIQALPEGIETVIVNGRIALRDGKIEGDRSGRMIRAGAAAAATGAGMHGVVAR